MATYISQGNQKTCERTFGAKIEAFGHLGQASPNRCSRALENLSHILRLGNPQLSDLNHPLLSSASASENHVVTLLREWWTRDGDIELTQYIKPTLYGLAFLDMLSTSSEGEVQEPWNIAHLGDDEILRQVKIQLTDCEGVFYRQISKGIRRIDKSPDKSIGIHIVVKGCSMYHHRMLQLFDNELRLTDRNPDSARWIQVVSQVAASMRVGYSCIDYGRAKISRGIQLTPRSDVSLKLKDCHREIPAIVEPCNWLRKARSDNKLPRYLWDIENARTIDTTYLVDTEVPYAIVSHTWGRWRKEGYGARLMGVPLWRIPENSLFDVTELPIMLKSIGFAEKYVWVDLLCIPQDRQETDLAEICQLELARQAAIFGNANTAVAWLTDVHDWQDAEANITWLALIYMKDGSPEKYKSDLDLLKTALHDIEKHASKSSGFIGGSTMEGRNNMPGWMSSLWTLQEVFMRPDMTLLNRDLVPLVVGEDFIMSIDIIASLLISVYFETDWREVVLDRSNMFAGMTDEAEDELESREVLINDWENHADDLQAPKGVDELASFMQYAELLDIVGAQRLTPLVSGRIRVATQYRAEAIMSVMDATDWHMGRSVKQFQTGTSEGDDMMFNLYPFSFIKELRDKTGAEFFSYQHEVSTLITCLDRIVDPQFRGTMLPFMPGTTGAYSILESTNFELYEVSDHPSVEKWELQRDGSVRLPQVAIVSSNNPLSGKYKQPPSLFADIHSNDPVSAVPLAIEIKTDLLDHILQFRGEVYALCTMSARFQIAGIIIQRPVMGSGSFVKAGTFVSLSVQERGLQILVPESEETDWHVL